MIFDDKERKLDLFNLSDYYMTLPYDLSGSRSKNRFRYEMMWGLDKIYSIYQSEKSFCIVFDYICDIEEHIAAKNILELYQIKTLKNTSTAGYPCSRLYKKNRDEKYSILGKLIIESIKKPNNISMKLAVVSNEYLKVDSEIIDNKECVELSDLPDEEKTKICKELKQEFSNFNDEQLKSICFIHSKNSLQNIQQEMIGKTVLFYKNIMHEELSKPETLFETLVLEVNNKACCEEKFSSYNELLDKKGISKQQITKILNEYKQDTDFAIKKVKEKIELEVPEFGLKLKYLNALSNIKKQLETSLYFADVEQKIEKTILITSEVEKGTEKEIIDKVIAQNKGIFPSELNEYEKYCFVAIVIERIKGGYYENIDNK